MLYMGMRVSTPLGNGYVAYVRMSPPEYTTPHAVSVVLDKRKENPGYTGTILSAAVVKPVED